MRTKKLYNDFTKKDLGFNIKIIYNNNYKDEKAWLESVHMLDSCKNLELNNYIGFFILDSKNRVLSSILMNIKDENKTKKEIYMLYSGKTTRLLGSTKILMQEIIEYLNKKNIVLYISCNNMNKNIDRFYQNLGFRVSDRNGIYIRKYINNKTNKDIKEGGIAPLIAAMGMRYMAANTAKKFLNF